MRTPVANAICKRALGPLRRERWDFVIPLSASYLRRLLTWWGQHYTVALICPWGVVYDLGVLMCHTALGTG